MNKAYRCIWNRSLNAWVAVSELVTRSGKSRLGSDAVAARVRSRHVFVRKPIAAAAAQIALLAAAPFASAQVVIPAGTDIGTYLNSGTNWSASAYRFTLNSNASWNNAVSLNTAAHSTLELDGNGNAVTRSGNYIFNLTNAVNNNSITLSNLNFGQTANSGYAIFYDAGGAHTSNINLNNVTFNGLQGGFGNVFYLNGTTGSTYMNVNAGSGADGVTFSNNVSTGDGGGVISMYAGNATFNGDYTFDSNSTDNYGGAIAMYQSPGVMTFNGNTVFNNNSAKYYFGGAIDIWGGASTLTFNGDATFTGNHVVSAQTGTGNPRGGAINIGYTSPGSGASVVQFNAPVLFDGNYVVSTGAGGSAYGGALSAFGNGSSYNYRYIFNDAAIFRNNYAIKAGSGAGEGSGGAIYYDSAAALVSLQSGTQFLDNYASTYGGAIYLQSGTVSLSALTDNIVFQGNKQGVQFNSSYQPVAGTGRPNAIYLGSSGTLTLNTAAGNQILFYDPLGSIAGSTVTVNKTGDGDVVFYGDNGASTSYDSAIQANTLVQGGNFVLADGVNYGSKSGGTFTITTGNGTAGTLQGNDGTSVRAQTLNLQNGGTIDVAGGLFTLDANSINVSDGGKISGSGTLAATSNINLGGNALATVEAGNTLNVTGLLAGSGGLTTQGGGTLELSNGGNSYTGATVVASDATLLGGVANAFAGSGTVAVDGTLDLSQNNLDQTANGLSGTGSVLLGTASLTSGGSANTTFSGEIDGSGALNKTGTGTLTLAGTNTYTGGTTISGGTLGATSGSALSSGAIANSGTLQLDFANDSTLANQINGSGTLLKTGAGTATLSAADSDAGTVNVSAGTLAFEQSGVFTVSDSLTTGSGASTVLGADAQLEIANALTQQTDSVLSVNVSSQNGPLITADSASLGGTLNVAGFSAAQPGAASEVPNSTINVISTTNGISGDFSSVSVGGATSPVDYLSVTTQKSADNLSYGVGLGLTWNAGATEGNGTFTLTDASEAFNLDVALSDQSASATGWNGTDLTKNGAGTLTLSQQNTYTGATTVNGGTLATGIDDAFADSSSVTINSGATLALNGHSQTANELSGAGSIDLGSSAEAVLTANNASDLTLSGTIAGAGGLTKTGAGELTLSGINSYSGGTTVSDGALVATNASALGTGAIINNAALQLDFADSGVLSGNLSGSGSLTKTGAGTATLSAATSAGAVSVDAGTLQLSQSGAFDVTDYTTQSGATTTIDGVSQLAASGTFTQAADSTLNIQVGANAPVVSADSANLDGALRVTGFSTPEPASASALTGSVFNVIQTTNGITGEFTSVDLGGAASTVDYLTLAAHKSADNLNYGVGFGLKWEAGATGGNGTFTLANATETFNADTVLSDQVASATGWNGTDLTKNGAGTLTLSAQNTYTGTTTVNGGTLAAGIDNAFADSSAVTINSGATLALNDFSQTANNLAGEGTVNLGASAQTVLTANNSTDTTFAGTIDGAGSITKAGAGTLTLGGANSYAGGTTITGGTLVGSAASFGSGAIVNDGALVIDQASAATFANAIDGTGSLTKTGSGSLNLTGDSNLSGATTVRNGLLSVNGYLGNSAVTVQNHATLGGNGTLGQTSIEGGGTISPGNSIGTLHVNGDFSQAAGSTYHTQIDPSNNTADQIVVNGAATIDPGAVLNVEKIAPGVYPLNAQYTVLSATDGVTGSYSLSGDLNGAFYGLTDAYDANHVYLKSVKMRDFVDAANTRNEIATAAALQTLPDGNAMKDAVSMQSNDENARLAFNQLSGELHASVKTALIDDSRYIRDTAIGRVRQSFCAAGADDAIATAGGAAAGCSARETEPAVWARAFGAWGDIDGDGNAARLRDSTGGFLIGTDTLVAERWRVGALAGYSRSNFNVDDRNSSASSNNYHLGVYGGTQLGNLGLRSGAAVSWHSLDTSRSPSFVGYSDSLSGSYNARTAQVFGDVGYSFKLPAATIEPFVNVAYVNLRNSGFTEQGGAAALAGKSGNTNTAFSTVGVRGSTDLALGSKTKVTLNGTLAWQRAFGNTVPESTLAFAGSDPFTVAGVPIARNAALVQAGVDFKVSDATTLGLNYAGKFGGGTTSQTVQGTLKVKF
ncbi:autotransporter domain-containing protein [Paraburkholderia sp. MMS20-SJTR3]|uniref:Autotransporter domain-containing protein n=1 Tax=Paraburkholderia sejongensis TaxID=2886946 RepID=A0ABS8K439_9BURK|nr:autotransporter domain-containing protein [Paraburkholderia sp. MMS20-SJTR3]MCC8396938.1 autotransporter domain-containing protein [Paraburkholderia sp. MMS20-SJTR3]